MNKLKHNYSNKIKKIILVPLITTSIMLGCTSIQKTENIHNVKNAISFVRNDKDTKILNKSMLMTNVNGNNVHYFKEYSQRSPKDLKIKRKINVHDNISLLTRATQDNFIYVSEQEGQIKGYVTLYKKSIYNSYYEYNQKESISFITTSIGELMVKVYSPEMPVEIQLFYNKIISESVISFLFSTYHLDKKESEIIINSIWKN